MKILFLSLIEINSIEEHMIYPDLLREFVSHGHEVYLLSPSSDRKQRGWVITEENSTIIKVYTGNVQKTNVIKKGINTLLIEPRFKRVLKHHKSLRGIKFDLVLYPTPPITLAGAVEYVKNRDGAKTYLMLKDIFPQNAVDIGMMSARGPKSIIYKSFRKKEAKLYEISDRIGCMSQANVDYVLGHNAGLRGTVSWTKPAPGTKVKRAPLQRVHVMPNSIEPVDMSVDGETRKKLREKYNLPLDKKIFVYGGNLGRPQDIPFVIRCIEACKKIADVHFLIVGNGTEYGVVEQYIMERPDYESERKVTYATHRRASNVTLMPSLPKDEYDAMIASCDVGLIFLDHRFTIPNFPSRLLSYMQARMPILACTDTATDIGKVITDGGFGWWCESNDEKVFAKKVEEIISLTPAWNARLGENAWVYLNQHYTVSQAYDIIMNR